MVDFTKPLQTLDGTPVRYLGVLNEGKNNEMAVVAITNELGIENVYEVIQDDFVPKSNWIAWREDVGHTIVNVPEEYIRYIIIHYSLPEGIMKSILCSTLENAEQISIKYNTIAIKKVIFKKGDGL